MNKLLTIKRANLIGNLYKSSVYGNEGYTYKIYLGKQTKSHLLSQSYVYITSKEEALDKLETEIKMLLNIDKDLFDFAKLEKM